MTRRLEDNELDLSVANHRMMARQRGIDVPTRQPGSPRRAETDTVTCRECGFTGPGSEFPTNSGYILSLCWDCKRAKDRAYTTERLKNTVHLEAKRRHGRNTKRRLKEEVLEHYGQACVACGERDVDVLTIDHIHNDGAEHRRQAGDRGSGFYSWLKRHGFPAGFQTLCRNCNAAKAVNGGVIPERRIRRPVRCEPL